MTSPLKPKSFAGRRPHDAANPLDAPGEHYVPALHDGERRVEPRRGAVGDLHVRQAAVVPALQQRGEPLALWRKRISQNTDTYFKKVRKAGSDLHASTQKSSWVK